MKTKVLILTFFCLSLLSFAQFKPITPNAEVSVLTIASGSSLNDAFGHSAFRIKDSIAEIDVIFDYGRYDFNASNFYLKFAQGKLNYKIGANYYNDFYKTYVNQNRGVKEQVLDLNFKERDKLYKFLIYNYRPENQEYLYDFFFDNCATKIKDVLQSSTNNTITFYAPEQLNSESFRSLIYKNVKPNSWGGFGIDLALGSVIDREIPYEQFMFLPEYIAIAFGDATLDNTKPLVKKSQVLYKSDSIQTVDNFFLSPVFVFLIISAFIIFITFRDFKTKSRSRGLDTAIFVITGLIGIIILLLWFATDHTATANNYNLLWAFFLNLFMVRQVFLSKPKLWFKKYIKFLLILLCLMTLHWIIGIQVFNIALLPLLIALFIRYFYILYDIKNNS